MLFLFLKLAAHVWGRFKPSAKMVIAGNTAGSAAASAASLFSVIWRNASVRARQWRAWFSELPTIRAKTSAVMAKAGQTKAA